MRIVAIIPARLRSTRLANKLILDIAGKPMIQHVFERVRQSEKIDDIYIATDSDRIARTCAPFTDNVVMTSPHHTSGTDRIVEALDSITCDGVINVQGDEPMVDPALIDDLADGLRGNEVPMLSAMHRIERFEELIDPNNVKVTVGGDNIALYFSRSVIPYVREGWDRLEEQPKIPQEVNFYKHIGIYAYTAELLRRFRDWSSGYLETMEKLEQLRVLERGVSIKMLLTRYNSIGVDTREDLEKVKTLLTTYG